MIELYPNAPAPEFSAEATGSKKVALKDQRGKFVILFFYKKDQTGPCTDQILSYNNHVQDFTAAGAILWGVSYDSLSSHEDFKKKFKLGFDLISDPQKALAHLYGADRGYLASRDVFIIDPNGRIKTIIRDINPYNVAGQVYTALTGRELQQAQSASTA